MFSLDNIQSYEKIRDLGEGASGKTFLVRALDTPEHFYALKVFSTSDQAPEKIQSFEQEWRVLESLNHPHLAKVFHHGSEKDHSYFTTEYVEGTDIVSACKNLDWNAIFILIVQSAWALDYFHQKGFIHRDIKPANILVGKVYEKGNTQGEERLLLKIIDFGLACSFQEAKNLREIVGTLPYIAPEILKKDSYDHRADLYSLGVIFYQIAVGRLPVEVRGQFSNYLQQLSHEQVDLYPLQEWGTPRGVVHMIGALLKIDPSQRISNAREIIQILNDEENENFPLQVPDSKIQIQDSQKIKSACEVPERDKNLSSSALIEKIRTLSRNGQKEEALAYVNFFVPEISKWKIINDVADFYAVAIQLRVSCGEFSEAEEWYLALQNHPVVKGKEVLEKELIGIDLAYRKGEWSGAEKRMKRVSSPLIQQGRPDQLARFYNLFALIAKDHKQWSEAVSNFEKAAQYAKKAKRSDQELALLMNAAATVFDQGEWSQAYHLYQQSLTIARNIENKTLLANITNNLGNLYLIFGRWNEAHQFLSESLEISEQQNLKPLVAYNLNLLTQSEEGKGNWEKAEKLIGKALAFSETLGDSQPILQAELEKAYFEWNQKKYSECLKSLLLLREKAEKFQQAFYLIQADWLEARVELDKKVPNENKVMGILKQVKADALEHGFLRNLWQMWADEALLYQKLDQKEKAQAAYSQALEVLSRIQEKIPAEFRESFWRDRKKEKIKRALLDLQSKEKEKQKKERFVQFEFVSKKTTTKGEVSMSILEKKEEISQKMESNATLSFEKWVEINRRLLTQTKSNLILDEIMDDAISMTDAERGFVIYSESQELDVKSCRNIEGESLKGEEERFSYTIAQEVMRRGESILIADAQRDSRFSGASSVLSLKIRSVLCVPLRAGLKTVGLVYLDNRFREGVFQQEHLPIIEALADQTSLALEHARLHQENLQKIEELKKSKELIERLNQNLEKDLDETSANLLVVKESLKRQNEEISLRYTYDKIIGESNKIKQVLKKLDRIVESSMSVFIHGESGTGKELIAQAIHFNGPRKEKPFIAENCTALPETLLESELFGHVQGSFTGADKNKIGLFELANGGTLFLDEVGDMPLSMQAKLLRVLQEGEVRQVGGKDYRKVDVRIITASNKDLKDLVAEGKFRQDLYYRINVVQIDLPPLRERREDVPLLMNYFIEQESLKLGVVPPKVTKEAMKLLMNYEWPGNIRELLNEVTRFISLRDTTIDVSSLSPQLVEKVEQGEQQVGQKGLDFLISLVEKKAIVDAMQKARGNKVRAAKILKIGRRTLYAKLDLYKIDSELGKNAFFMSKANSSKLAS